MTPTERGLFFHLLCHSWQSDDCGLPNNEEALAHACGCTEEEWQKARAAVLACFKVINGRLYNMRLCVEFKKTIKLPSPAQRWYRKYLRSDWWRTLREIAIRRAENKCQDCGSSMGLQVHHASYDHLKTDSEIDDLVVLCDYCHKKAHGITK